MQAVILEDPDRPGVALLPIAGRPVIARQIQWLRALGCSAIAVEIGHGEGASETARWLSENDALGAVVHLSLAARKVDPREIALRAGLAADQPLLVVPAGVLGGGEIAALLTPCVGDTTIALAPPAPLVGALVGGELLLLAPPGALRVRIRVEGPSWGVRVRSHDDALALSSAAIARLLPRPEGSLRDPIQIHAAEREPGVWLSRGARIEPGARLIAPVLIGAGAVVRAGAQVGPNAFVGDRAVVESGASLVDSVAAAGTIVGEGVRLERSVMDAQGVLDLVLSHRVEIDDPLLAGERDAAPAVGLSSRAIGLGALALLAPVLLVAAALAPLFGRRLFERRSVRAGKRRVILHEGATGLAFLDAAARVLDLALGRRALVGLALWKDERPAEVSPWLYEDATGGPHGVITVDDALTPPGSSPAARLRARLWYAHTKSVRGDLSLLASRLRGWGAPEEAHSASLPP
jgi:hypothetical protein